MFTARLCPEGRRSPRSIEEKDMHTTSVRKPTSWIVALVWMALTASALAQTPQPAAAAPTRTADTAASTLYLSGSGYLNVPNAAALNPSGGLTVEAWVRRIDTGTACQAIAGKGYQTGLWLGICGNKLRFYSNGALSSFDGATAFASGEWTHVAATFDGTTRRLYVNGNLDAESVRVGPLPVNAQPLRIGADVSDGVSEYRLSGHLADVRLWGVARSRDDIRRDMVRLFDAPTPGLIAAWHLEGTPADAFGAHNATGVGAFFFNGPAAPPTVHAPIKVPRLPAAPTINGECNSGEYGGGALRLRLPMWLDGVTYPQSPVWLNVGATSTNVYVCMERAELYTSSMAVYLDPNNSGDALAQATDWAFIARASGPSECKVGDGAGGYVTAGTCTYNAVRYAFEFESSAEFVFPRSLLPSASALFRLAMAHQGIGGASGTDRTWPLGAAQNAPVNWPTFVINDADLPRADSANPTVSARHTPDVVRRGATVYFTALATDDVDIESIDLIVDGVTRRTCGFAGANDRAGECTFNTTLPLGRHGYYARVVDHRGRAGFTPLSGFLVQVDGRAPVITLSHSPRSPAIGAAVTINATATDPSGVRSIGIGTGVPSSRNCTFSGTNTTETCTLTVVPGARRIVNYNATATDAEGLYAYTPGLRILFGNTPSAATPDTDNDGIVDEIERLIGTRPTNPDTDRDSLPDGWEVLGLDFGGEFVNLPALGANPLRKDVFVQYDYERGAKVEPETWPHIIELFRRHGISLHLTENERPRPTSGFLAPTTGVTSTIGADQAAATIDPATGQYYFPPKLSWTHHYLYSRHNPGRSGAWHHVTIDVNTLDCPLSSPDPQNDPACRWFTGDDGGTYKWRFASEHIYRVVHELGHNLGLGHGGRQGTGAQTRLGDIVYYAGDWESTNQKPHYISAMNYRYSTSHLCYKPPAGDAREAWLSATDYQSGTLPSLNEAALFESSSLGYTLPRNVQCDTADPAFVPAFHYGCTDGLGQKWIVLSDGTRTLGRVREGSEWQFTGLPAHGPGVDWNCNGSIQAGALSHNINGDGVENAFGDGSAGDTLTSPDDWTGLPYGPGSGCWIARDTSAAIAAVMPAAYRAAIGGSDCRLASATDMGMREFASEASLLPEQRAAAGAPARPAAHGGHGGHDHGAAADVYPPGPHQHDTQVSLPALPNLEQCNGVNDDGDDQIDEGCLDMDSDGIADAMDSCPGTPNPDQADANANGLGDACERPTLTSLALTLAPGNNALAWSGTTADVLGYAVYRQCEGEASPALLGEAFPTTTAQAYTDATAGSAKCQYVVRVLNRDGVETDERVVGNVPVKVFMPVVMR
jgi:hypothetical protein